MLSRAWCCLFPLIGHFGFLSRLPLSTRSQTSLPQSREEVFGDVLVKKQACLGNRNMDLKKRKPWHFFKGDSPWVGQKVNFFFSFIFVKNRSRKSVCWCSRYKRSLQRQEEQSFMKNAKWEFFQRGRSIFFIESFRFRQLYFLCKINKKNVFRDVLVKKKACLDNRNVYFKKGNLDSFWKGIVHDLVKKLIFFSFVFIKNRSRKSVYWLFR